MGLAISDLPSILAINDDDVLEVEQAGASRKVSKALIEASLGIVSISGVPLAGEVLLYDGTTFINGPVPRWRVVPAVAYTFASPATTSTITFTGGGPTLGINLKAGDYFAVGSPVRVEIGVGTYFYGICTAVADTLLTISGAILPLSPILSLAVGTLDMVKNVEMRFSDVTYNSSTTLVLTKGCQHRWHGATGYLCSFAVAHMNTSSTTQVTLQMNGGADVVATGVIPAAGTAGPPITYGAFTASGPGTLIAANVAISHNQTITAKTPVLGGTAQFLVICMTFVVP